MKITIPINCTVVLLYRKGETWWITSYAGDTIPAMDFPTARMARQYARWKRWGVKRAPDCDA